MTKRKRANTKLKRSNIPKRRGGRAHTSATKTQTCLDLLSRASGATVKEMQKVTGWQPHSVRGFLSGKVRKKLGLDMTSTEEERGRVYRILGTEKRAA